MPAVWWSLPCACHYSVAVLTYALCLVTQHPFSFFTFTFPVPLAQEGWAVATRFNAYYQIPKAASAQGGFFYGCLAT